MIRWLFPKIDVTESKNETHNVCELLISMEKVLPRWLLSAITLLIYVKIRLYFSSDIYMIDSMAAYVGFFIFSFLIIVNLFLSKCIITIEDPFV